MSKKLRLNKVDGGMAINVAKSIAADNIDFINDSKYNLVTDAGETVVQSNTGWRCKGYTIDYGTKCY
jgi:hypothetical protein